MMKNKIVVKLEAYFTIAILIFAIIISSVFLLLFRNNTIQLHKVELEERAKNISETLAYYVDSEADGGKGQKQGGGYGVYIKYLGDIAMADVWVVDENLNILTKEYTHTEYTYSELPDHAEEIVKDAFSGQTTFSEDFSSLLNTPTLTVGTPIVLSNGTVYGVLLLHSPVNGINFVVTNGFTMLAISIGLALIIALLLSSLFSVTFTKPLKKMNDAAIKLAGGDYSVTTNIVQNDEIGELAKNFDILSEKLLIASKESENLEKLRRDLISNVSHELRTPITVIRGSLEALKDKVITDPVKVQIYYDQMLSESKALQRLVGDLLDLSKLQNADFRIEMADQNILDILYDVIRSGEHIASSKNISINFENTATDLVVKGDFVRLRQMIMIILDNAIKFSPVNGKINIKLYKSNMLTISITDEGPGIEKEMLPYIFDRFHKTKSSDNKDGSGLGLAIANQIALRHNAKIKVESQINKGSTFYIKLNNNQKN
jgi:signal transduction histidine kinase